MIISKPQISIHNEFPMFQCLELNSLVLNWKLGIVKLGF